jgi:ribosomal protein S18 acetylase RimI-like enzyme
MEIVIEQLQKKDLEEILKFIKEVIKDNFLFENRPPGNFEEVIDNEMATQRKRLEESFGSKGIKFLVAKKKDEVVGTIGYYYSGPTILKAQEVLKQNFHNICEIVSVYVKPEYQRQNIGSLLLKNIFESIKSSPYEYFGLSTAYKKGLAFWRKKFGETTCFLPKYYNDKADCSVWIGKISEVNL